MASYPASVSAWFNVSRLFSFCRQCKYSKLAGDECDDDDNDSDDDDEIPDPGCSLVNGWSLVDTGHLDPWHHVQVKVTPENVEDVCALARRKGHKVKVLEVAVEGATSCSRHKIMEFWRAFPKAVLTSLRVELRSCCVLVHSCLGERLLAQHRKHPGLRMNVHVYDVMLGRAVESCLGVTSSVALRCLSDADVFCHLYEKVGWTERRSAELTDTGAAAGRLCVE